MALDRSALGRHLAEVREQAGISPEDLAMYLGEEVVAMESGQTAITVPVVEELAALYGCSLDALMTGRGASRLDLGSLSPSDWGHVALVHRLAEHLDALNTLANTCPDSPYTLP